MADETDPSGIISNELWQRIQEGRVLLDLSWFNRETGQVEVYDQDSGRIIPVEVVEGPNE